VFTNPIAWDRQIIQKKSSSASKMKKNEKSTHFELMTSFAANDKCGRCRKQNNLHLKSSFFRKQIIFLI